MKVLILYETSGIQNHLIRLQWIYTCNCS